MMSGSEKLLNVSISQDADTYGNSKVKKSENVYEWRVENFGLFLSRKYEIPSPVFIADPSEGTKWRLILLSENCYPKGLHVGVSLVRMSEGSRQPLSVKYKILITTKQSGHICLLSSEKVFKSISDYDTGLLISHAELREKKLLIDTTLILRCEMDVIRTENSDTYEDSTSGKESQEIDDINSLSAAFNSLAQKEKSSFCAKDIHRGPKTFIEDKFNILSDLQFGSVNQLTVSKSMHVQESLNQLCNDFKSLYMSKNLADTIISVEGAEIRAHKAVLAARSEYFRIWESTGNSKLVIHGIKSAVMEAVLYYIYTGQMREMRLEIALDMLTASRKFRIPHLELMIIEFLQDNIDADNVTDILLWSEELNLKDLKQTALKFVSSNYSEVVKSDKWNVMLRLNPHIAREILIESPSVRKNKFNF
ncbi:TD and POZ domain-containing protein 1-like [Stegodyphus dumicola]|uniref:TD and POZ domain-containing protein 1-like n=1 Tax=Stegodyphus dumicola TaxID=202533 RepID=UPI0015B2471A|nr:TD and POZ domain-containing protein 1-like [Stegodyphus dumicola]